MAEADGWPIPWTAVRGDRDGALARLEYLVTRAGVGGLARLPRAGREALCGGLARVAAAVDRRHGDAARRFLEQAFGPELGEARREELVRGAFRHLIRSALEDERLDRELFSLVDPMAHCEVEGRAVLESVTARPGGALVATCHLGAWEVMAGLGPHFGLAPLYVVSRPPRNRPLSAHFQARREGRGYRLIPRHGAIADIPRVVAAGGTVALMLDQRARGKTAVAPFFGRPAHCERAIAVLARRLKVPVLVGAGVELAPGRYRVSFPRAFFPNELARLRPEELLGAINAEFERMILAHPEQYLWLHDRYRKAPAAPAEPVAAGGPAAGRP